MDKLGINGGYFLVQLINFLTIFIVIRAWVVKPIVGMLEKRRETIAQGLEDARVAAEARANAEQEAAKILADAQAQAAKVVSEATAKADEAGKAVLAAASAEATKLKEAAADDGRQEKVRVLGDLRNQVAALSIAAAQKLVGESLDEKRQHALIAEFFSGVKSGKVMLLDDAAISGDSALVTSALPLTDEEQSTVKKDVLAKLGGSAQVTFQVDPAILGGLVIRVGDKVVDGSVSGRLSSMADNLR